MVCQIKVVIKLLEVGYGKPHRVNVFFSIGGMHFKNCVLSIPINSSRLGHPSSKFKGSKILSIADNPLIVRRLCEIHNCAE